MVFDFAHINLKGSGKGQLEITFVCEKSFKDMIYLREE